MKTSMPSLRTALTGTAAGLGLTLALAVPVWPPAAAAQSLAGQSHIGQSQFKESQLGRPKGAMVLIKPDIVVDDTVIRLGDLFADLDAQAAGRVIANAPAPGQRLDLDAKAIRQLIGEAGYRWPNATAMRTVPVTRASRALSGTALAEVISEALSETFGLEQTDIQLADRNATLHMPTGSAAKPAVTAVDYAPATGQFAATLAGPAGNSIRVAGRAFEVVTLPILARDVQRGNVIGEGDIAYTEIRKTRLAQDFVRTAADLIGQAPRRSLSAGRPLRFSDVSAPRLVERNATVRLIYKAPGMELAAVGQAMDAGAAGDVVRVRNMDSRLMVHGVVSDDGSIRVGPRRTDLALVAN